MNIDSYNKIQTLIESGVKENIILAFQLAKLEKIPIKEIMAPWRRLKFSGYIKGESIEDIVFKILNLKKLHINLSRPNFLKELPKALEKLKYLEELKIVSAKEKTLPSFIGKITNLKSLNFSGNNIKYISDSIGNLNSLEELIINRNPFLVSLPDSIGNLSNLEYLNLDDNNLTSIPKGIIGLSNLKYLQIHSNQIKELPKDLGLLKNLEHLSIYNNPLKTLPKSLLFSKSIKKLGLSRTKISRDEIRKFKLALPNCNIWTP